MTNEDLAAIEEAWDPGDPETKNVDSKRDEAKARQLADDYVEAHPDEFVNLKDRSLEDCVKMVDVFRAAGLEEERLKVEAWLLHRFEPQNIGGTYEAKLRTV